MAKQHTVGGRDITVTLTTIMRIEQLTGETAGEIYGRIVDIANVRRELPEDATEEQSQAANLETLKLMGDITFMVRFLQGLFGVPQAVIESDYGDKLFEVFGDALPAFGDYMNATSGSSTGDDEGKSGKEQAPGG